MSTSPNTLPITVAILADQITEDLKQAIASVPWASEIIVLDSRHHLRQDDFTDRTKNITIVPIDTLSDFAVARNSALKHAKCEWVFFLDSDEYLLAPLSQVMTELGQIITSEWSAASFGRRDVFYGKELRWGELLGQRHTRLLHKTLCHFVRPVHEVVVTTGQIKQSSLLLRHQPHLDITEFMTSVNRYAQQAALSHSRFTLYTLVQLWLWPVGKWLVNVILKAAWLDGWRGIVYATMMSWHSWLVRSYHYARTTPQKS